MTPAGVAGLELRPEAQTINNLVHTLSNAGGEIDLDALVNYFEKNSPISPGPQNRVTRIG